MSDGNLILDARFELLEQTGQTEFGPVYRARYTGCDEIVAIRVRRDAPANEAAGRRLVERLKSVPPSAIVCYRDCVVGQEGDRDVLCMVTDWIEGETLRQKMGDDRNSLSWVEAEPAMNAALDALMHACGCGIVHTAITPAHIIVTPADDIRVTGFSMLGWHDDASRPAATAFALDYLAPEFLTTAGFEGDPVSEIFSFAVCMHEVLTGELPFLPPCGDSFEAFAARWETPKPELAPLKRSVLRVLINARKFLKRALAPARDQRFSSLEEASLVLQSVRCRVIQHEGEDDYELLDLIGRGGYGAVYRARRKHDARPVAFKYLALTAGVDRFKREAKILHGNPHPNLVEYVDFFATKSPTGDDQFFLVMELLPGMPEWTLSRRIRASHRGLPIKEVVHIFCGYLEGLQYLHDQGIIHRDIKPGNLYAPCDAAYRPKLIDLGIARDLSGTQTVGMIPGTWDYMAPELFSQEADRGTPKSDLYALALCMYEAATGQPAMPRLPRNDREAAAELMRRIKRNQPMNYALPVFERFPWLTDIIRKALSREPSRRFASAAEMRAVLAEAARDMPDVVTDDDGEEEEPATVAHLTTEDAVSPSPRGCELPTSASEAAHSVRGARAELARPPRSVPWLAIAAGTLLLAAVAAGVWYFLFGPGSQGGSPVEPGVTDVPVVPIVTDGGDATSKVPPDVSTTPPEKTPPPVSPVVDPVRLELDRLVGELSAPLPGGVPTVDLVAQWSTRCRQGQEQLQAHPDEAELQKAVANIQAFGREIPRRCTQAFNEAMDQGDREKAARLLSLWEALSAQAAFMDLDAAQAAEHLAAMQRRLEATDAFEQAALALESKLPREGDVRLVDIPALDAGYRSLVQVRAQEGDSAQTAARDARLAAIEHRMAVLVTNVLVALRDTGTNTYMRGHDDTALQQDVKAVSQAESAFVALAPKLVESVVTQLSAMRASRDSFFVELTQLTRAVAEAAGVRKAPARFEQVAVQLAATDGREHGGVSSGEKTAKLDVVRGSLRKLAAAELASLRAAADTRGREGQPMGELAQVLEDYRARAPTVVAMLADEFEAAAQTVAMWEHRHRFSQSVEELQARIRGLSQPEATPGNMQTAAKALDDWRRQEHPDVPKEDVDAALVALRTALTDAVTARITQFRDAVTAAYAAGEKAEPLRERLLAFQPEAPDAVALAPDHYAAALASAKPPEGLWVRQVIRTLEEGKTALDEPLHGKADTDAVNRYLEAAARVRKGMNVSELFISDRAALDFQAAVGTFWNAAAELSGNDNRQLESATWRVIHGQLAAQVEETVGLKLMVMSPRRQTQIRRTVLGMVCRLEAQTGQVSKCNADDPLRLALEKYFREPFYAPAILEQGVVERVGMAQIEWLAEMVKAKEAETHQ